MHTQREQLQARASALQEATIAMTGEALWRTNATRVTHGEIVTQYTPKASSDAAAAIATTAALAAAATCDADPFIYSTGKLCCELRIRQC